MLEVVNLDSDVLTFCFCHAHCSEKEEVMGLLIGEVSEDGHAFIHAAMALRRSDKRKDRVEISPEQLANASSAAESLGLRTRVKRPLRIVGWYHSHPHITVHPSHVDIRTQGMYQMMDSTFVGIIVSCFNNDSVKNNGNVQVTCFQAGESNGGQAYGVEVPLKIEPVSSMSEATSMSLVHLPQMFTEEEDDTYRKTLGFSDQDLLTAVHNGTVYTQSICRILDVVCSAISDLLKDQLTQNQIKIVELERKRNQLIKKIGTQM